MNLRWRRGQKSEIRLFPNPLAFARALVEKSAGSKSGVHVDFYRVQVPVGAVRVPVPPPVRGKRLGDGARPPVAGAPVQARMRPEVAEVGAAGEAAAALAAFAGHRPRPRRYRKNNN